MRRREALRLLAALGLVGLAGPGEALGRGRSRRHERGGATRPPWRVGKQLVVVFLQGGPDGLSVAAPVSDPLYHALRPTTSLSSDCGGLELGRGFLLHPAMAALGGLHRKGQLAVVPACAMPGVGEQHGPAQEAFARGAPSSEKNVRGGWLGRLSLALGGWRGQMLVAGRSTIFSGAPHYSLVSARRGASLPGLPVEDQALYDAVERLYAGKDALDKAFASGRKARRAALARLLAESRRAASGAIPAPAFPDFALRFGRQLAKRRDVALAFLAVGGFDTHSGQGGATGYLADRLRETAVGLSRLATGLDRFWDDTVIVALGEFGRGARENGFGGTDNGQGGVMLVMGGPVAGGLRGDWPGLAGHRLAGGRDVAVATDWRDVAAGICTRHLGLPEKGLAEVFPGFRPGKGVPDMLAG